MKSPKIPSVQRPTDRDAQTAADEFAESLAELEQARLVSTPGRPKEVLLSDEPPEARTRRGGGDSTDGSAHIRYPEWDYRVLAYNEARAIVRLLPAADGPQQRVDSTLAEHRSMLDAIRGDSRCCAGSAHRCAGSWMATISIWKPASARGHDLQVGHPMAQAL